MEGYSITSIKEADQIIDSFRQLKFLSEIEVFKCSMNTIDRILHYGA